MQLGGDTDITSHGTAGVWDRQGDDVGPDRVWGEVLGFTGLNAWRCQSGWDVRERDPRH